MQDGINKNQLSCDSTKELGLTRDIMNSLALFIYNRDYASVPNTVDIFNEWASTTNIKFDSAEEVCAVLEHIRKLAKVNRKDLRKAILMDCPFTDVEELYNDFRPGDTGFLFTR